MAWSPVGTGLPMGNCNVLSICERNNLLRTATSRGVWEVSLESSLPPVAIPSVAERVLLCTSDTAKYFDHSSVHHASVSRRWTFEGGVPSTSTDAAPRVTYTIPGTYSVRLQVTDKNGTDTHVLDSLVTVISTCTPSPTAGKAFVVGEPEKSATAPGATLPTRNFTITAWIRRQGAQADFAGIVFTRSPGTATGLSISSDDRLRYHAGDAGWWIVPQQQVPDTTWSHVALAVRNDTAWLAVDGVAERFVVRHPDAIADADIHIGRDPTGSRTFRGAIDEVRIYSRALSIDEIRAAMFITNPISDGLAGHWQFEQGTMIAADVAGGHHASLPDSAQLVLSGAPVARGSSAVVRGASGLTHYSPTAVGMDVEAHAGSMLMVQYDEVVSQPPSSSERGLQGGELIVVPFEPDTMVRPSRIDVGQLAVGRGEQVRPTNVRLYARPILSSAPWGTPVGQARSASAADASASFVGGFFFTEPRRLLVTSTEPVDPVSVRSEGHRGPSIGVIGGVVRATWPAQRAGSLRVFDLRGRICASAAGHGEAVATIAPYHAGVYVVATTFGGVEHLTVCVLDESGTAIGINPR